MSTDARICDQQLDDPRMVATKLSAAAHPDGTVAVTVGIPLSADGDRIVFGPAIYDPITDKRLVGLPERITSTNAADLEYATQIARELRTRGIDTRFSISAFDGKIAHVLTRKGVVEVHEAITQDLERYLPAEARELYSVLDGELSIDFSLNYRRLGTRLVDKARSTLKAPVPAIPSDRHLRMFHSTGGTFVKQIGDHLKGMEGTSACEFSCNDQENGGIANRTLGGVAFVSCNTIADSLNFHRNPAQRPAHDRLDGKAQVQLTSGAIPLTNDMGNYICEVTAIGRLLAMTNAAVSRSQVGNVATLSILNICDPGNHKMARITWSAAEIVSALTPYLYGSEPAGRRTNSHMSVVSDARRRAVFDYSSDHRSRAGYLDALNQRLAKARTPARSEDILAGQLERLRRHVLPLREDLRKTVLLYGPGDDAYTDDYFDREAR